MHTAVSSRHARLLRGARPLVIAAALLGAGPAAAENVKTLKGFPVPLPPNLGTFVRDRTAAIQLGKALFWDTQAGGDGVQACASCHFQAGADVRTRNTVNPGANGVFNSVAGADAFLVPGIFPIGTDDVVGSQGVIKSKFNALTGTPVDNCTVLADPVFNVGGRNVRQVTGRNTPSNVNAVFNFRSFWDGRANNVFNGVNPAGPNDPTATVLQVGASGPVAVTVSIPNASLASQAVGPPNNPVEMSCAGRTFPQLGRKLLNLRPLGQQTVSPDDSVLGPLANTGGTGLTTTYPALIQAAFQPQWWNSTAVVNGFSVMENNFSLYWGLSILVYESTLVSDDTPVDRFLAGNGGALGATEQLGLNVFTGKGRCVACHEGAELTAATVRNNDPLKGFLNTAVRPVAEDQGDIIQHNGKFKTPGVRNVELNGPYFHNGGMATLREVVEFYNRGGDFPSQFTDGNIRPLGLTETEKSALVAFLVALTDDRVRFEKAPFDHPSLTVPNGPALPAVGKLGRNPGGASFLGLSPFQP
jgi:cytochrome c peroxidase